VREIELKFEVGARDHAALRRAPALRDAPSRRQRLHAIYFDTADHLLMRNGMALRVRREGRRWVQCLKAGRSGEAGLHARSEWEVPRPDASLDPAAFEETPLAALVAQASGALEPLFEVDMQRTTWTLELDAGARVEVALDRGEVRYGTRRDRISELEIESVEGDPDAVFAAAERLVGAVPLRASAVSKAQRGYALARGDGPRPRKSVAVVLDAGDTVQSAASKVVSAALAQMQANEALLASEDPEYVHQFRVGLRRLRSALRVFGDAFEGGDAGRLRAEARRFARIAGAARDWDVLAEALPSLERALRGPRRAARTLLREALRSPRYTRFVLRLARWLARPRDVGGGTLIALAQDTLERQHRKVLQDLARIEGLPRARRHRLRIRLKRLRYACQSLASLYDRDAVAAYVEALARLQDDLGGMADAMAGRRLLASLTLSRERRSVALEALNRMERESLAPLPPHVAAFEAAHAFWRAGVRRSRG
jgi:inorganic triphosphatase YgiF